ncbi:MAG: hypothetical protein WC114_02740 [Smithellaceae bacterium]|jgi:hypothetical protein
MNLHVTGQFEARPLEYSDLILIRIGKPNSFANGSLSLDRDEVIRLRDELLKLYPLEPAEA